MKSHIIVWKRSALKEIKRLPKELAKTIGHVVSGLAKNPFPPGVRKLVGSDYDFRIRVGDYRIIYTIHSEILTIEIIKIGHRREVYKK